MQYNLSMKIIICILTLTLSCPKEETKKKVYVLDCEHPWNVETFECAKAQGKDFFTMVRK